MSHEIDDRENALLATLEEEFMLALAHKEAGQFDEAEDLLRELIRREPRLPEPHMELARILLDTDRVAAAEPHAREAISHLEAGGQWVDDIPEHVVQAIAHGLLAEILRRRIDEEDVIFGDPAAFHALVAEARAHFERAHELDPSDAYASYHAFFMGVPNKPGGPALPDDADPDAGLDVLEGEVPDEDTLRALLADQEPGEA